MKPKKITNKIPLPGISPLLFGKPTLVTRVGIGHEIEQAQKALVAAPDNAEELSAGLDRLLRLEPELVAAAKEGPAWVKETFDVMVIARQLISIYGE